MNLGIPEAVVDEIRQRSDLVSLVGEHLSLEKRGKNLVGLCPFHSEKTPSFSVSPEKQLYHCFGCSASGNVFSFIMKIDNLTFIEAARFLAKRAGVEIPEPSPDRGRQDLLREKIYELNRLAVHFFSHCLRETSVGKKAADYLQERGIDRHAIELFKIGYAPRSWDKFACFALSKGFSQELLLQAGLVVAREGGSVYDRFRHRVIFPIFHMNGKVLGFGGRSLEAGDQAGPKYLNSPETAVFQKGAVLYGLNLAREQIRREKRAIVVEGYTDVITAHLAGMTNVIASQGTALTAAQARLLRSQAESAIIAYDADRAGEAATWRGLKILSEAGCLVRVAELPAGSDPDSLIRKKGAPEFMSLITGAAPLVEYQLSKLKEHTGTDTTEGRLRYLSEALSLLRQVTNLVERDFYLKQVAEEMGASEDSLRSELRKYGKKGNHVNNLVLKDQTNNINQTRAPAEEKILLALMLNSTKIISRACGELCVEEIEHPLLRKVVEEIWRMNEAGVMISADRLIEQFKDPRAQALIGAAVTDPSLHNLPAETMEKMAGDCIARIKEGRLKQRRREAEEKLKEMEKQGFEQARSLLQEQLPVIVKTGRSPYRFRGGEEI